MGRFPQALLLILLFIFLSCSSAPEEQEEISNVRNRAAENTEFGNTYFNRAKYDQALSFFNLALTDNISVDNEEGIVQSYNSIGKVYLATGSIEAAENNFRLALGLAGKIETPSLISQSANNLGEVFLIRIELERPWNSLNRPLKRVIRKILLLNMPLCCITWARFIKNWEILKSHLIILTRPWPSICHLKVLKR